MAILIDGYNLLHASGIFGRGVGPGGLERARRALLNFLAAALEAKEIAHTAVVFDAHNQTGLPCREDHEGIAVHYAAGYEDADSLIEEMILHDSAPRALTVVSSDHRIQRAARRRKAIAVDSDQWYVEMQRRRRNRDPGTAPSDVKPLPPTPGEVQFWLSEFAEDEPPGKSSGEPNKKETSSDLPDNPFPPGYFDDLEDELKGDI